MSDASETADDVTLEPALAPAPASEPRAPLPPPPAPPEAPPMIGHLETVIHVRFVATSSDGSTSAIDEMQPMRIGQLSPSAYLEAYRAAATALAQRRASAGLS